MAEFINVRCPVCLRAWPPTTWERTAGSEIKDLGVVQVSLGRGLFKEVGRLHTREDLEWVSLEGFGLSVKREPDPFYLVKRCLLRALTRWRGWFSQEELESVGLVRERIGGLTLPTRERSVKVWREVNRHSTKFEL